MRLHRSPSGLVVHAPAKLNLFFEVLGKRADGYHEVETLVVPITLYDTLEFRDHPNGRISFQCQLASASRGPRGTGQGEIPEGSDNLVVRAVELVRRRANITSGAELCLAKRIPSAAGLGGGSSDAAAALIAANEGWQLGWSVSRLAELAAELGSDVPLFLTPGPAICRGRGEIIEPVGGLGNLHLVVVRPPAGLSTADVYRECRPPCDPRPLAPLVAALRQGNLKEAGRWMFNRLESAAERLSPWIARLRHQMQRLDCLAQQMSGSGTCYFGLCRHARHARRVAHNLEASGLGIAFAVRGSL